MKYCELCNSRNRTVFGVGDLQADCLIVGEAPGADEDRLGDPFVGRAGQLLNSMLRAIGLKREHPLIRRNNIFFIVVWFYWAELKDLWSFHFRQKYRRETQ